MPHDLAGPAPADLAPEALIDLARYPLDDPGSPRYRAVVQAGREAFAKGGAVVLEGFVAASARSLLVAEAERLAPQAFNSRKQGNPYGRPADEGDPADHPARILSSTDRHGVAYHMMRGTALEALYRWGPVRQLVADLTGHPRLYLHEDPSNALVLQIYKPGGHLAWHFDRAQFSSIIHLQDAEAGGYFESVPNLRRPDDECFGAVSAVLRGDRRRVLRRRPVPGTFSILPGRHTLHRVTPVAGARSRISLVLSYEEEPGRKLDLATRRLFFGPTAPDTP